MHLASGNQGINLRMPTSQSYKSTKRLLMTAYLQGPPGQMGQQGIPGMDGNDVSFIFLRERNL